MSLITQFNNARFFRHCAWRRHRVERILRKESRARRDEDPLVLEYLDFCRFEKDLIRNQYDEYDRAYKLHRRFPELSEAHEFNKNSNTLASISLQSHLLTELTNKQIAERFGVSTEVVDFYSNLFFDVRDRIQNVEYIAGYVIGPVFQVGIEVLNPLLLSRYFGYFGGSIVLQHVLYGLYPSTALTSDDEMLGYLENVVDKSIRLQSAIMLMLTQPSRFDLRTLIEGYVSVKNLTRDEEIGSNEQSWVSAVINYIRSTQGIPRGREEKMDYEARTNLRLENIALEPRTVTKQKILESGGDSDKIIESHRVFELPEEQGPHNATTK